jgi:NADPH:quinone reductase-like Zn-dependent oxidoreductase
MRAVCLRRRAQPPELSIEDVPRPSPGEGEVLVRVHAAGVTPTELEWAPTWTTPEGAPRPVPIVPGHELSGEVAAVGPGVHDLAPGDAVYGMNDWYRDGTQAEYCVARAVDLAAKPGSIDHAHAAAVPISALTAWQGLVVRGGLARGQRVLIQGGSGGVGIFAVQMARARGAHVIATASTANLDLVRELGADEVIDYRTTRFQDVVRDVDLVFDGVGGETLLRSWDVLRPGGKVVTIAASSEQTTSDRVRDAFFIVEPSRPQLEEVARSIDAGALRVLVGAELPLAEAQAAYRQKPPHGKVVLRVVA